MKNKASKIWPAIVCGIICWCLCASANVAEEYVTYSTQEMRSIALTALTADFAMEADAGSWEDVVIVKETPLYNFAGELISYCFDLKCGDQNAYIIISATSKNYPVRQFASHATSSYLNVNDKTKSVYAGPGEYFIEHQQDDVYQNIVTGEIREEKVEESTSVLVATDEVAEDFDSIAQLYISGQIGKQTKTKALRATTYRNITGVPLYSWKVGCAPTAMGMIIAYHYSGFEETALINKLGKEMNTTSSGSTLWANVASGTRKNLTDNGKSYTSIAFRSTILGFPQQGPSYNTFEDYQDEIMANRPVFIAMNGATHSTTAYPSGFGDHAVTGVGFNIASQTTYIIMHTTSKSDGDVSVPLNTTDMGSYAWCFVIP